MQHYKKNCLNGFVLFSVLLFLQIFALLGLYGMITVKLMLNNIEEHSQSQIHEYMSENILGKIEKYLLTHLPNCFIPITPPSILSSYNNVWWQQHACRDQHANYQYHYVVERLGKDACTRIINHGNDNTFAEYYRITLRFSPNDLKTAKIILQSVIVKANDEPMVCSDIQHVVKLGRQMRRELFINALDI